MSIPNPDTDRISALYEGGLSARQVALEIGIGRHVVERFLQKSGLSRTRGEGIKLAHRQGRIPKAHPTHGRSKTPEYRVWNTMIQRCYNPKANWFARYGGRGIQVCQRWRESFAAFIADMGDRPPGLTIERRNNDGNYEPANCYWATHRQQTINRRLKRNWHGWNHIKRYNRTRFYGSVTINGKERLSRGFLSPRMAAFAVNEMLREEYGDGYPNFNKVFA